ncbi:hypothetical protein DFH06DRAFT_1128389 [Mycena polygramma]|nr:hypothetical protein DFH06DRAFT_1148483 [Mycena polygramma]KAJ7664042.1 hypothetical protein DFH06DRAFT_1128389 [Mycena polygramma]
MALVQPPYKASTRQQHAWSILPADLKPTVAQEPKKCEHGKARMFSINLGDGSPNCGGNLTAYTTCDKCPEKYRTLTTPTPRQRRVFMAGMARYDETVAAAKESERQAKALVKESERQAKALVKESERQAKALAKETARKVKSMAREQNAIQSTPSARTRAKAAAEADGARAGSAGKTPQPQGSPTKGKGKEIETPPRKKAKRTTNNLTPAVPSKQASTKQSKDVEVCLFFEADKEAIRLSDTVPDVERFEFTQHKIFDFSNALATVGEPTVYVRYSPHFGDFRSVQESRVFGKTNISESGDIVIYRAQHLTDGQCPGLEKLKFEVHMLSNCASNEYPSFSIAGPSTLKRTRQVMEEDEDDDGDADEELEENGKDRVGYRYADYSRRKTLVNGRRARGSRSIATVRFTPATSTVDFASVSRSPRKPLTASRLLSAHDATSSPATQTPLAVDFASGPWTLRPSHFPALDKFRLPSSSFSARHLYRRLCNFSNFALRCSDLKWYSPFSDFVYLDPALTELNSGIRTVLPLHGYSLQTTLLDCESEPFPGATQAFRYLVLQSRLQECLYRFHFSMHWNLDPFAASVPDDERKKDMAALSRLAARAPLEAAEGYLNLRPYKERPGHVYTHLRPNWEVEANAANAAAGEELDWVDLKVGKAEDVAVRRMDYELDCVDEPILWAFSYETSHPKLIERLTHLTLWAMHAKRVPYPCHGCGVRHREHFSEARSGGLEVVAAIIEYWLARLGEPAHSSSGFRWPWNYFTCMTENLLISLATKYSDY